MENLIKKIINRTDENTLYRLILVIIGILFGCVVVSLALVVDDEKVKTAFISIGSVFFGCLMFSAAIDWLKRNV